MKRLIGLTGALAMVVAFSAFPAPAKADSFGLHVSGPGYHFDIGRARHRRAYYGGYGHYGHRDVWHDTSHWDYHPGEYIRHRNHYHYVPGHYDYHETGHWDHYHGW